MQYVKLLIDENLTLSEETINIYFDVFKGFGQVASVQQIPNDEAEMHLQAHKTLACKMLEQAHKEVMLEVGFVQPNNTAFQQKQVQPTRFKGYLVIMKPTIGDDDDDQGSTVDQYLETFRSLRMFSDIETYTAQPDMLFPHLTRFARQIDRRIAGMLESIHPER